MPPQGTRLTPGQVDTIRQWITQAALRREHWAFRPLVRPDCRSSTAAAPRRLATRPTRPCGCRTATRSSSTAMLAPTNRRLSRLRPTSGSSGPSKTSRCSATRDLAAGRYLLSWRPRDDASGRVRVADAFGWVAERLNAPVLKTGSRESGSWVQIPPHPLFEKDVVISASFSRVSVTRPSIFQHACAGFVLDPQEGRCGHSAGAVLRVLNLC